MKTKNSTAFSIFRAGVCLLLLIHGAARIMDWETAIPGLGSFLNSKGLIFGNLIAVLLTVLETAGSLLIGMGKFVKWIAPLLIIYLVMGIIMVHMSNGWFVVGPSQDGMEYNVLLVICMTYIWFREVKPEG